MLYAPNLTVFVVYLGLWACPLGRLTYSRLFEWRSIFDSSLNKTFFQTLSSHVECCFVQFKRSLMCHLEKDGSVMTNYPMSPASLKILLTVYTDAVVLIALSSHTCRDVNLGLAVDILTNFLLLRRSRLLSWPDFQRSWTLLVRCLFQAIPRTATREIATSSATDRWILLFSNSTSCDRFSRKSLPMV